jgi:hypothetical protein
MAPLPPNGTPRFRVNYTNVSRQHTLEIRSGSSPSAIGTFVDDLFTALVPILYPTVIDNVVFAASGSNVFNAVTTGIEGNTYGGGSPFQQNAAWFISFIGRTSGGRRARMYVFGVTMLAVDYRYVAGEQVAVDAAISVINAFGSNLQGIDGLVPIWKSYANGGVNSYWQKHLRP